MATPLTDLETFLSPKVKELVTAFNSVLIDDTYVDSLAWKKAISNLASKKARDYEWYKSGSCAFALFCKWSSSFSRTDTPPWLSHADIYKACSKAQDKIDVLKNICLVTSCLERSLGDLFATLNPHVPVPSLLRDLVLSESLVGTLGPDLATLLECVFGGPRSLNLRNLAWHGFLLPGEIHPLCIRGLEEVSHLIGQRLIERRIDVVKRPLRCASLLKISSAEENSCEQATTPFLAAQNVLSVHHVSLMEKCHEYHQLSDYASALCLALPLLESLLRLRFAQANSRPERTLTAENDALYTTMTEILAERLEDGQENRFIAECPDRMIETMLDVFSMPEGPRIRDRMSHGEIQLCLSSDEDMSGLKSWCEVVGILLEVVRNKSEENVSKLPKPRFHPSNLLAEDASVVTISCMELLRWRHQHLEALEIDKDSFERPLQALSETYSQLPSKLASVEPAVLYRRQAELSLVNQARKGVRHIKDFCEIVKETIRVKEEALCENKLSKRQCNSYRKMLIVFRPALSFLLCVLDSILQLLLDMRSDKADLAQKMSMFKKLVPLLAQLCASASPERNEWDKAEAILSRGLHLID